MMRSDTGTGIRIYVLALAVFLVAMTVEGQSNIIVAHPSDITEVEGCSARFKCHIENLDINYTVQWSVGGFVFGPWRENYHSGSFFYPSDGDISMGIYDLIVDPVSWYKHADTYFECQITEARKRTQKAFLTVIVPPAVAHFSTTSDGLFAFNESSSSEKIICQSTFATPGSQILWLIDGQQQKQLSGQNSHSFVTNHNGARLEKITSSINVSRKTPDITIATPQIKHASKHELTDKRAQLEKCYERVYRVTCQISNPKTKTIASKSEWVAFGSAKSSSGLSAGDVTSSILSKVLTGISVMIVIVSIVIIIVCWRHRTSSKRAQADQSPLSDGESSFSMSSSSGDNESYLTLHGEMRDANGSHHVYVDPYSNSCGTGDPPVSLTACPTQYSVMTLTRPRQGVQMGNQFIRFLDPNPPHYHRTPKTFYRDQSAFSLPRSRPAHACVPRANEAARRLSTFASLPRGKRNFDDSLPPPPEYQFLDPVVGSSSLPPPVPPLPAVPLPPPEPLLHRDEHKISYSTVTSESYYRPPGTLSRGNPGAMSASPRGVTQGVKFQGKDPSSSLV